MGKPKYMSPRKVRRPAASPEAAAIGARIAQARRVKACRDDVDIGHVQIAAALGVSGATVSRWESGEFPPSDPHLILLARYLGVTRGWLRYGDEPRYPPELTPSEATPLGDGPPEQQQHHPAHRRRL